MRCPAQPHLDLNFGGDVYLLDLKSKDPMKWGIKSGSYICRHRRRQGEEGPTASIEFRIGRMFRIETVLADGLFPTYDAAKRCLAELMHAEAGKAETRARELRLAAKRITDWA